MLNPGTLTALKAQWHEEILPLLCDYIRIPNKSPMFDPDWAKNGYMDEAVALMERWARAQPIEGLSVEVVRLPGRTPLLFMEVPGAAGIEDTVLLYGHLDKQPEMTGWAEGLGPWVPVLKDGRLYGRGGADDGYACFASLSALLALAREGKPHARAVILIEACEESGSYDLPHYIDHLAERIGRPSLIVCLDSGCGDYERLWLTTSLRGLVGGILEVEVLEEGVHSGDASGIVPSSFRIARLLLDRLEDAASGAIRLQGLHVEIPELRVRQAMDAARVLGDAVYRKFPFVSGMRPTAEALHELILNRTWRPALEITGGEGLPPIAQAGNVLRPRTALKLSMRLPPTLNGELAKELIARALNADPPYGARVRFRADQAATGWEAPPLAPWLENAVEQASLHAFGQPPAYMGEGGTIPFMAMLGEKFPGAQFLITGVLGPHSNAHGPNEFLDLPTAQRLTQVVAEVLAAHAEAARRGLTSSALHRPGTAFASEHGCC
ncbi:MAG: succinyl-diaminopimelate desuccinylase [Lysobacterales bacterium]|jgi:acetylornithine deacetylase/succinyl-diaminopimelate desuccinylase-like protein|nr:MAG: succinyl-diaminopimelate desuccinylase [Xanthomonadales bacterium]